MESSSSISMTFSQLSKTLSLFCLVITLPLFGFLVDRFNKTLLLKISILLIILWCLLFCNVFKTLTIYNLLIMQSILVMCIAMFNSAFVVLFLEVFQIQYRYHALGVDIPLAGIIFDSSTLIIGTALMQLNDSIVWLMGYIILLAGIGLYSIKILSKIEYWINEVG